MMKLLSAVLSLAILATAGRAADAPAPTIEEVNSNPDKFVGKTLTFEKVELLPPVAVGQLRYRFTLRTPAGKVFKSERQEGQELFFATRNKNKDATKLADSLKPGYYYTVTLTVEIKTDKKGKHFALVKSVTSNIAYQDKK